MAAGTIGHCPPRPLLGPCVALRLPPGLAGLHPRHVERLMMGLPRPRVLVVSRDRTSEVLGDLLAVLDCDVELSPAAGRAFQREYDLLVLDLDLPDIDAWSVAKTVRRVGLDARRLILTSAAPTIVERNRADRLGATLLRKPVVLEEFAEQLARAFNVSLPAGPAWDVLARDAPPSRLA
jgi:CheY-like chemotaxis protein